MFNLILFSIPLAMGPWCSVGFAGKNGSVLVLANKRDSG